MRTAWSDDDKEKLVTDFLAVTSELDDLPQRAKDLGNRRRILALGLRIAFGPDAAKAVDMSPGSFKALVDKGEPE